jgi:serine/threonine protein kinase
MSFDRWADLDRIFAGARQLAADARARFVQRECGDDESLRREALQLLAADEASSAFMAEPALDRLAQAVAAEGWSLQPGERIGAYTIVRRLGSGGAGEVWRARDERLGRDVAIKVLLPHHSHDPERLRRFADEARAAGALNHSNILTVYDVGEHQRVPFIVSECLEGQSLRQRLEAGSVPVDEAVALAVGIAQGLAAAHARGIVHRDLKPENIFIRPDGGVKILDFGLAKLQSALEGNEVESRHTITGVIVGTADYMAPEQVKGEPIDVRTDLFALGLIMYEMLAGQHPLRCASTFETLHAVITSDPVHLSALNGRVPPPLAAVVMRLLKKVPGERFQSTSDLAWTLQQLARGPAVDVEPPRLSRPPAWWRSRPIVRLTVSALTAMMLVAAWWLVPDRPRPAPLLTQFTWTLPPDTFLASAPAVSPDSRHIAFTGRDAKGSRLFVRALGSFDAITIPGTNGARHPFWASDGRSLAFFAGGRLMKVAWPGGAPLPLAEAPFPLGGSWSQSGVLLFGPDVILAGLRRVTSDGGQIEEATRLDLDLGDNSHGWPSFLPDGRHFLYFVRSTDDARRGIYVGRVDRPASATGTLLWRTDSGAVYVPQSGTLGDLLSVVNGRIEVRRFDTDRLALAAESRTIGLSASGTTLTESAMLSASPDVLAFATSTAPYGNRLEIVRRSGEHFWIAGDTEPQNWPRVSPDGRYLARQRVDLLRNNPDIWVDDLERRTRVRITTAVEPDIQAVWSPDGRYLAYVSGNLPRRAGERIVSIAAADGSGVVRTFPCPGEYCEPTDWSPGGQALIVNVLNGRNEDVWLIPADGGAGARPILAEAFPEHDARMAPSGRWVAFVSEESGRPEVSVRSLVDLPARIVVSGEGGAQPVWRRDGAELFFVDPQGRLNAVPVKWTTGGTPAFGLPIVLPVPPVGFGHWGTQYDVSPDGSLIYLLRRNDDPAPRDIHVVLGWRALLH